LNLWGCRNRKQKPDDEETLGRRKPL